MKMARRLFISILVLVFMGVVLVSGGLPTTLRADPGFGNHYAYAHQESAWPKYTGVKADIEVAIPVLRDPLNCFSSAQTGVATDSGQWVEAGWLRTSDNNCVVKHFWAKQPGVANFIDWPLPGVGGRYEYRIAQDQPGGKWSVTIYLVDSNSNHIQKEWQKKDINPGFTVGSWLGATGETFHSQENDMGVSGLLELKWRDSARDWHGWHGWKWLWTDDYPPYYVGGVPPDTDNNVQVQGNQGNPVPPDAACP